MAEENYWTKSIIKAMYPHRWKIPCALPYLVYGPYFDWNSTLF